MADDLGEKTEQPTTKRLSDARERGQVARSTDLSSAILLSGAVLLAWLFAQPLLAGMLNLMRFHLSHDALSLGASTGTILPDLATTLGESARVLLPMLLLTALIAYLSGLLQIGFLFSGKALQPSLNRLNPLKGLAKLFSKRSLVKGALDVMKFAVIGAVVIIVIRRDMPRIVALAGLPLLEAVMQSASMMIELAVWVLLVLFILAIIDFSYQRWQRLHDLKMTKHEVKDERKSTEGDMETKARRMKLARQIAMQRLQQDVPQADVIVTNPTHFSIAIKYDESDMRAPRVIAKGADYVALRMRYIAAAHRIPIVERPPLARALYRQVPVGAEIHPEHYEAVAEVLAYVYRLEGRAAS